MLAQMNSMAAAPACSHHAEIGLEHAANGHVGEGQELNDLLGLRNGAAVDDIIKIALLNPVKDVTSNRGKPALHIRYGLPTALNAGNWLYLWPAQLI